MTRVTPIRRDDATPDPEHRVGAVHDVSGPAVGLVLEIEFLTGLYWGLRRPITSVSTAGQPHQGAPIVRWVPIAIPHEDLMAMVWDDSHPPPAVFEVLNELASDVPNVVSSPSRVRCNFLREAKAAHMRLPRREPRRPISPGRLRELERKLRAGPP